MNNIVLSRSLRNLSTSSLIFPLLYPTLCTSRAASLNSAIHHGIRRSKGVGFRGKERSRSQDVPATYGGRDARNRRSLDSFRGSAPRSQMRDVGAEDPSFSFGSRNSSYKPQKSTGAFRNKGIDNEKSSTQRESRRVGRDTYSLGRQSARPALRRRDINDYSSRDDRTQQSGFRERPSNLNDKYPSLSNRASSYDSLSGTQYTSKTSSFKEKSFTENLSKETNFKPENNENSTRQYGSHKWSLRIDDRKPSSQFGGTSSKLEGDSPSQSRLNTRIPVSIPYTTPASEFLYGTSVVEAALSSRRIPRRKHYKLYIYNGENREGTSIERDAGLERLAKKNGVEVTRVKGDWLRVMDKMSGGRPHNGYILEASPLPRKPVTSLGEFTASNGQYGFMVTLDHQSREEAAVNGTDDFVRYSSVIPGRKPLVLLLDSIVDPGNLGGIIRTASFLGVTAIAISTRNSASFTSVVLKASAGASENVTLFSVNKPAGFLVDSKLAGWKVYAAVAPSTRKYTDVPESMTTDELEDPLSKDPCILMLGGEGDGLRWNLRSKADIDLSICGSGQSHNVDSLNVSVATGLLCSAFLRKSNTKKTTSQIEEGIEVEADTEQPTRDLF